MLSYFFSHSTLYKVIYILLIVSSFFFGFFLSPIYWELNAHRVDLSDSNPISQDALKSFSGNNYTVYYPLSWGVSGPYEAPISGFPEYLKLISPSGDLHINIGLKGDGRFTATDDAVPQNINTFNVKTNGKEYIGEESFLLLGGSSDNNGVDMVTISITLEDVTKLGTAVTGTYDVFQPMRIQILYRMPKSTKSLDEQLATYSQEKAAALSILESFRAK